MTWEHDRVDELLAGYVLGGLDPEDAELASRALVEHVPECERCRRSLEGYRVVSGDIALAAAATMPPETLGASLARATEGAARRPRRSWIGAAAAAVAVLALGGWNALLVDRVGDAETEQAALLGQLDRTQTQQVWLTDALSSMTHPKSSVVPLKGTGPTRALVLYVRGEDRLYVIGSGLPEPDGSYVLWFMRDGSAWTPGPLQPIKGAAIVRVETDASDWEHVLVTEEPSADTPTPTASPIVASTLPPK